MSHFPIGGPPGGNSRRILSGQSRVRAEAELQLLNQHRTLLLQRQQHQEADLLSAAALHSQFGASPAPASLLGLSQSHAAALGLGVANTLGLDPLHVELERRKLVALQEELQLQEQLQIREHLLRRKRQEEAAILAAQQQQSAKEQLLSQFHEMDMLAARQERLQLLGHAHSHTSNNPDAAASALGIFGRQGLGALSTNSPTYFQNSLTSHGGPRKNILDASESTSFSGSRMLGSNLTFPEQRSASIGTNNSLQALSKREIGIAASNTNQKKRKGSVDRNVDVDDSVEIETVRKQPHKQHENTKPNTVDKSLPDNLSVSVKDVTSKQTKGTTAGAKRKISAPPSPAPPQYASTTNNKKKKTTSPEIQTKSSAPPSTKQLDGIDQFRNKALSKAKDGITKPKPRLGMPHVNAGASDIPQDSNFNGQPKVTNLTGLGEQPRSKTDPIRYFNDGVEVNVNGGSVITPKTTGKKIRATKTEKSSNAKRSKKNLTSPVPTNFKAEIESSAPTPGSIPNNISSVVSKQPLASGPKGKETKKNINPFTITSGLAPTISKMPSPDASTLVKQSSPNVNIGKVTSPPLPAKSSISDLVSFVRLRVPEILSNLSVIEQTYGSVEKASSRPEAIEAILTKLNSIVEGGFPGDDHAERAGASYNEQLRMRAANCARAIETFKSGLPPMEVKKIPSSKAFSSSIDMSRRSDTKMPHPAKSCVASRPSMSKSTSKQKALPEENGSTKVSTKQLSGRNARKKTQAQQEKSTHKNGGHTKHLVPSSSSVQSTISSPKKALKVNKKAAKSTAISSTALSKGPQSEIVGDTLDRIEVTPKAATSVNPPSTKTTPTQLSQSNVQKASVDDLVRDSIREREKTLSAANVLLGFMKNIN